MAHRTREARDIAELIDGLPPALREYIYEMVFRVAGVGIPTPPSSPPAASASNVIAMKPRHSR